VQRLIGLFNISIWALFLFLNACQSMVTTLPAPTPTISVPVVTETPSCTPEATALRPKEGSPIATIIPTAVPALSPDATATQKEITRTMAPMTSTPSAVSAGEYVTITIVYDNNPYDPRLRTAWGFAALVEYRDQTPLFDTGGDGRRLLGNMAILGIDPRSVESVVLSHTHGDHTGGLSALLATGVRPTVYLPPSFSRSFKDRVSQTTVVVEVAPGQSLAEGLFTTGEMGRGIPEQALVIRTDRGLAVVTGCAHPGVVQMTAQAKALFSDPVYLVLGGFHLGSKSDAEISAILAEFRRLGVEKVAPCHCTGERAISRFAAEYGEDFIQAGVGRVITVEL
jgi:7,8-dihydropterin-6-yl-methyl-4-(beta-D-ribofuranosyl)aminobenzene 5'-phosphate synthase